MPARKCTHLAIAGTSSMIVSPSAQDVLDHEIQYGRQDQTGYDGPPQ
jgi:hypothetical protein